MGKLAEIKTKPSSLSAEDFINSLPDEQKRKDSLIILKLMEKAITIYRLIIDQARFFYLVILVR